MQLSFVFEKGLEQRNSRLRESETTDAARRRNHSFSDQARNMALDVGAFRTAAQVTVAWNSRLQTTAGTAEYRRCHIDLNPRLRDLGPETVDRILRHELAHLVAHERAAGKRIQPHGPEWKQACTDLGIPGEKASHSLPLRTKRRLPRYAYRCPHCEEVIFRVRRMARHSACYACCKKYNDGEYHPDFAFERVAIKSALNKLPDE